MDEKFILEIELNTQYGWIKTFYHFDLEDLETFESWVCELEDGCVILDSGLEISNQTLKYKIIKSSDDSYDLASDFLETFGRPFDLLEQIDGFDWFDGIGSDAKSTHSTQSDDSELYNDTETISNIISAHMEGNEARVKELLETSKNTNIANDDIISNIKNKYI